MSIERAKIRLTIRPDQKVKVWVLVSGGWFPLLLAACDVLIVDRNVVSALQALEVDPLRRDLVNRPGFRGGRLV
jgi:hypothetical protein